MLTDNPNDYCIVPKVATTEQLYAMHEVGAKAPWCELYLAAISASPPHNLVAVDKGELERLREIAKISLEYIKTGNSNYFQQLEELLK